MRSNRDRKMRPVTREPCSYPTVPVVKFNLNVNSRTIEVDVDPDLPLLWALRGHLKLSVDGMPVRCCITPFCTVGSARITTSNR
jgi:aerobic-type carbon monoxide dehydrogenase small subunit (CoxS/CutS family)